MNINILMLFSENSASDSSGTVATASVSESEGTVENTISSQTLGESGGGEEISDGHAAMPQSVAKLLQMLASEYGIDSTDPDAISNAYNQQKMRIALESRIRTNSANEKYKSLIDEAGKLSEADNTFNLSDEMKNPKFAKLVKSGFNIEEAWKTVHADDLMEKAVQEAERRGEAKVVSLLRAGSFRPDENGMREQGGISRKTSVECLTGGGIRDILRRVENGAKVKF